MKCPKCGTENSKVVDKIDTVENEIYRKRKCDNCGGFFFTVEFEIEITNRFKREWMHYQNKRRSKVKNVEN